MTSLFLRLHKNHVVTSMGAVATLQHVAGEHGEVIAKGKRFETVIPANGGYDPAKGGPNDLEVAVDPGRWLIEVTLPSGEVVTDEVTVLSGQNLPVTFRSVDHSPHEWLGLQYLNGNVEGADALNRLRYSQSDSAETNGTDEPFLRFELAQEIPIVRVGGDQRLLTGADAWMRILSTQPRTYPEILPTEEDYVEASFLYKIGSRKSKGHTQIAVNETRPFAYVETHRERFMLLLPLPWPSLSTHEHVPVQVMVRTERWQESVQIGVIVEDSEFATMAGFMTSSTLSKAIVAVRKAQTMLFGKMMNPLAAAAGGYVLLATGDPAVDIWGGWIDNLSKRFRRIPDGAVLKASLLLRFPKSKTSASDARKSFLEAFDRGIPYYSAGVSWLLDGLTVFADDPVVEEKMKIVQRVAQRLDLSQAFTVIRISDKSKE